MLLICKFSGRSNPKLVLTLPSNCSESGMVADIMPKQALDSICTPICRKSLQLLRPRVVSACGNETVKNLDQAYPREFPLKPSSLYVSSEADSYQRTTLSIDCCSRMTHPATKTSE